MFLLFPFLGAAGVYFAGRFGKKATAFYTALIVLITGGRLFFRFKPVIFAGESVSTVFFGAFPLLVDGLSWSFGLLIIFIGLLIILYAAYYLDKEPSNVRFFTLFLLFMGSMLGVVLSNHLILSIIFWEMTSLLSFLLIAYWHSQSSAREGAIIALTVTSFGGLALLAAALLMAHVAGSFELTTILFQGETIKNDPFYPWILTLFFLGVFTKSAQVPFHFWLPGAMHAPTPVSAYLHSATLVKAGIFLLARFYPALAGSSLWFYTLTVVGLATFIFGAYNALSKKDLKSLLAYSTISHLGLITTLFGYGTPNGAVAGIFHLFNHSAFKASLFMAAGIIEHECGTRDMRRLGGLYRFMPATTILALVATGSMAGVPLLNGFLSKELFFDETLNVARTYLGIFQKEWWVLPLLVTLGSLFSVVYSLRFALEVFFGKPSPDMPKQPHDPALWVRIPVTVLVLLCILVGIFPQTIIAPILRIAARGALLSDPPVFDLKIWHGFSWPLAMSVVAIGGGILLYHSSLFARLRAATPRFSAVVNFHAFFRGILHVAYIMTPQQENIRMIPFWGGIFSLVFGAMALLLLNHFPLFSFSFDFDSGLVVLFLLVFIAIIALLHFRQQRLLAVFALSVTGLGVALIFAHLSGPDLALTQILIEMATLIFILLALTHLPSQSIRTKAPFYALPIAILAAFVMGTLTLLVVSAPAPPYLASYFAQEAEMAGGKNLVNLILVDFRGFDTFGESLVTVIALLGVLALLRGLPKTKENISFPEGSYPLIFAEISRIIFPLAILVAFFLFLRGHQEPGGGFSAALLTSGAIMLLYLAHGARFVKEHLPNPTYCIIIGMFCLLGSGVAPLFFASPFLTSFALDIAIPVIGHVHLVTSLFFDLGVWLTVTGVLWLLFRTLAEV